MSSKSTFNKVKRSIILVLEEHGNDTNVAFSTFSLGSTSYSSPKRDEMFRKMQTRGIILFLLSGRARYITRRTELCGFTSILLTTLPARLSFFWNAKTRILEGSSHKSRNTFSLLYYPSKMSSTSMKLIKS
jgi:hypothetical protein